MCSQQHEAQHDFDQERLPLGEIRRIEEAATAAIPARSNKAASKTKADSC
jgi:hypothetical protein